MFDEEFQGRLYFAVGFTELPTTATEMSGCADNRIAV
jgi:hypothetical protein